MLKRIHWFKKKTNKFNKKKEKNYPYTKSILSSLFPVLYTNNFTSNACFCIGDAINPGQRFKTRLPLSSDLKTVYVPEASRRSVSVVDRPGYPPFPLADCFWQQIIDLFIFSFCPRSPISSSPLPPFFSKPSETWRGVSTSRGKVCRPGGKDAGRRSARDTRAEQLSDIHGWQIARSTGHVLMKLYRAVCSRVGWKMKNETTPSCPMNSRVLWIDEAGGGESERLLRSGRFQLYNWSLEIDIAVVSLQLIHLRIDFSTNNIDRKWNFLWETKKGINRMKSLDSL